AGNFLYKNYKQAIATITEYTTDINAFMRTTGHVESDFGKWIVEEREYLLKLRAEPEEDILRVSYVEGLKKLGAKDAEFRCLCSQAVFTDICTPEGFDGISFQSLSNARTRALQSERAKAERRLDVAMTAVDSVERLLGITERWIPSHPEYIKTEEYIKQRNYIRAVEELEGLVVQRLVELSKANMSGTGNYICIGYKLHKHISQAITRRSSTLCKALDHYNELAKQQKPPRPVLEYSEIANYGWLGEFELLKESRGEVLEKPWAKSASRDAATKYFKVVRAREEIARVNVEIRRLQAWIDYEDNTVQTISNTLSNSRPLLSAHITASHENRRHLNVFHRKRLQQIYRMPGFSGIGHTYPATADEDIAMHSADASSQSQTTGMDDANGKEEDDEEIEDDEGFQEEMEALGNAIEKACSV
ncbi:hypothetical protein OF83DRAFT_1072544, partial [Amylostereum chailletii]